MSLRFIAGSSGSGKTTEMHKIILERSVEYPERNFIVLVPEQFNMQTQRDIVLKSPRQGIMNIDVLSFMRLSHRIFDEAGAAIGTLLTDTGKSMIIRRVAALKEKELGALAGRLDKAGYIDEVKSVISEFMEYDIFPGDLDGLIEQNDNRPELSSKLRDLRNIYEGYIDYLGQKYITSEEILDRAVAFSGNAKFLEDAELYLDGYTGFTPIQLRFLEAMLKRCRSVVVTVTLGSELISDGDVFFSKAADDTELFSLGINTVYHLSRIAKSLGAGIEEPVTLASQNPVRLNKSKILTYMSQNLFRVSAAPYAAKENAACEDIRIAAAQTMEDEAAYVCRQIHELVRNEGCSYSDIAILTGDPDGYEKKMTTELVKYDIPHFFDVRHRVMMNPLSELLSSIVEMTVRDYSYRSVIRFLKCSLTDFTAEEIEELENYIACAGIRHKRDYFKPWTRQPEGYTTEQVQKLDELREHFADLLGEAAEGLPQRKRVRCDELVRIIYSLISRMGVYETFMRRAGQLLESGDVPRYDEFRQIYERMTELFDLMVSLLGDELLSVSELGEIMEAGLSELSVGILPPGADEVLIGDIERSRLSEVKHLFLMGVNDGVIPADAHKRGILSELDRQILKDQGVTLAAGTREQAFIQRFYIYMYLTKASERLTLTYSMTAADGSSRIESYLIGELKRLFPHLKTLAIDSGIKLNEVLTEREGLEILASKLNNTDEADKITDLLEYYMKVPEYKRAVSDMVSHAFRVYVGDPILASVASALYGVHMVGSITRLERFAACAYAHFLQYGLRLREKREYTFEARDLGSIYHRVLEKFGKRLKKESVSWMDVSKEKAAELAKKALDETFAELYEQPIYASARSTYMETRIRRVMERTISVLTYQIQKGDFSPEGFELGFNIAGFKGTIDRLDVLKEGDKTYLRVVDYKSGVHEIDMSELYEGISLQLPLYMREALRLVGGRGDGDAAVPAGMLYYHIHDPIISAEDEEDVAGAVREELVMRGLVDSDPAIIAHMDRDIGERSDVIKVRLKKDGKPDGYSQVISSEDMKLITDFAAMKARSLAGDILYGKIEVRPYTKDKNNDVNACRYCRYGGICGFDESVSGYAFRDISSSGRDEAMEKMRQSVREGQE